MLKKLQTKILIISFKLIVLSSIVFPQNIDSLSHSELYPFVVDSIKIIGNESTKNFVILKELTFNVGDTLTHSQSFYNRERVYSLGIFNQVYFIPTIVEGKRILNIKLEESWYIYPIPFIDARENDLKKLSYGLNLKLKNFRGRNEEIAAVIALGYDPTFYLSYYNPNLTNDDNIFLRSKVGFADVSNKSLSAQIKYGEKFSQKLIYAQVIVGKRLGLFQRLYIATTFSNIETPKYVSGINASKNRIDNVVDLGIGFEFDTRDLSQFPKNGIYSSINFTYRGLGIDGINYGISYFDFREYRKIFERLISKWRFATRITIGDNIPYYDYSILGSNERVRGHISKKIEGNDLYFGSVEFYYPIIEELKIDLTFIPIIPNKLLSYRVGFYTQIFAETGLAKYNDEPFALNKFISGYGCGITLLILPYQILRFEVGFDEKMNEEFIFDLGISF